MAAISSIQTTIPHGDLEFLQAYQEFLSAQRKHPVHPLHDSDQDIRKITQTFLNLFSKTPAHMKKMLATSPLFPEDIDFKSYGESRESTRPLNYVMFLSHFEALEQLRPYLEKKDWECLGPYGSTFMHCIIAGIQKGPRVSTTRKTVECAKALLGHYPDAKNKKNAFHETPLEFLQNVKSKLKSNLDHIQSHGGGGMGGLNKCISFTDEAGNRIIESTGDYEFALQELADLEKLLTDK